MTALQAPMRRISWKTRARNNLVPFGFTAVTMVLFAIFFVWPAVLGLYYSFTNYRGFGTPKLVGFANYMQLFSDSDFYQAVLRTLTYAVLVVPLGFVVPLFISVLLVGPFVRWSRAAQILFFVPWLISPIVAGVIWRWMFGESFGVVNFLLSKVGIGRISWQTDSNLSLATVVIAAVWGGLAFNLLLFMAALRNIPRSYYEAAEIDGASSWRQFWSISLPLLRPTSFMVILLSSIGAMKEFALVQALNGGGPGNTNYLMVQYIYHTGFELNKVGYASAASFVLMVMLLVIALIQVRIDRRTELG
ncbi:MAG TPA: sugar ABC transporter permease [Propionibacteriaceae bacterium]|nr:sugar ABC transporter permease [Propionibacteriaceae bacterium]